MAVTDAYEWFNRCRQVASALRSSVSSTFGPCGHDKLLVSSASKVLITNSGYSILSSLLVQHPGTLSITYLYTLLTELKLLGFEILCIVAKVILDSVKRHSDCYGDGSTSLVIMIATAFDEVLLAHMRAAMHPSCC
jgi:chaperonin GroEL (HSP60 family)